MLSHWQHVCALIMLSKPKEQTPALDEGVCTAYLKRRLDITVNPLITAWTPA